MHKFLRKWSLKIERYRRVRLPRRIKKFKIASRHPHAVPIITFAVLIILTACIYVIARETNHLPPAQVAKVVIISHDNVQQIVPSHEPTVGKLLQKLNLQLHPGDVVEPSVSTPIDQDAFRINIYRAVPVEVLDGTQKNYTFSAATTPRAIAQQAGYTLSPADIVTTIPAENMLQTGAIGEQVVINRALNVNLNLYGTPVLTQTHAATVADLIKEENIHLLPSDQVTPAQDTPITSGIQIFIERNGVKIESDTESIPMPIQTIDDPTLAYGTNAIRQQGSTGQQVTTYQDNLLNGVVIGRTGIQTVVTQQPVTEIVVIGTSLSGIKGDMALAGIAPGDYQYADYIISNESGWCPTKAQGQYGGCPPFSGYVPSYGGYGLCQSTPGIKMSEDGADWATNPITQLEWCSGYAHSRYGSWAAAYDHWASYHNW